LKSFEFIQGACCAALLASCCSSAIAAEAATAAHVASTEIEIGGSHETLTGGRADWTSVYVEAVHRPAARQAIYGTLRETRRFSQSDTEGSLGVYYPLAATWTLVVEGSASPTHRVLPRYAAYAQLQKLLPAGWNLGVAFRHSEYTTAGTNLGAFSVERYWGNFRGAYTLYVGRPEGAPSASAHAFQLGYYYGDRDYVTLSHTTGREVENVGSPSRIVTTDVSSWSISGRHWIAANWAVTYELLTHDQGDLYRRRGGRVGLRYGF
jgi:YaiO family outer membrane protein